MTRPGIKLRERLFSSDDIQVSRLVLEAGQEVPWHFHSHVSDTFYVLRGPVTIQTREPEATTVVEAGAVFRTRARQPHRVSNASDREVSFVLMQGVGAYDFHALPG